MSASPERARAAAMVIDTSALLATLWSEPARDAVLVLPAADAWRRFGKRRHPAGLNVVDCCSCALAAGASLPLLAVGEDVTGTDLEIVPLCLGSA